jgi:hypothetical protein
MFFCYGFKYSKIVLLISIWIKIRKIDFKRKIRKLSKIEIKIKTKIIEKEVKILTISRKSIKLIIKVTL